MTCAFLFGAGASHGSLDCQPTCPPLGGQLFAALTEFGGAAAEVDAELAQVFGDFEKGMGQFLAKEGSKRVSALLRDTARFLINFSAGPGNLYRGIVAAVRSKAPDAVLGSLNYDILLEQCILRAGADVYYGEGDPPAGSVRVLKVHGSSNFLPDLPPLFLNNVEFETEHDAANVDGPVRIASRQEVIEFCRKENSIAPAIAIYAEGKPVPYCRDFVKVQQRAWAMEVAKAGRVFIIGAKVHPVDHHVWKPLSACPGSIFYAGLEGDSFVRWARDNGRTQDEVIADTFESSLRVILEKLGDR